MNNYKYILWDFDGTLAYRDGMWTDTLFSVLINNNIKHITKEELRPFLNIGFTWHSPETPHHNFFNGKIWWEYYEIYFQEIYEKVGIDTTASIKLAKKIKAEYLNINKWHVYEDVENVLNEISNNNFFNIILSNHVPELDELVHSLQLDSYFLRIYSSANIGFEKPNKKIFEFVLNDLKIKEENCIMIGDSYEADVAGALRSGITPILVRKDNSKNYKWYCKNLENIYETIENIEISRRKIT